MPHSLVPNIEVAPVQQREPSSRKPRILSQNLRFKERKLRLRWLLAISSLPLFGIITAFGIAPQTTTTNVPISTVVESIQLPELATTAISADMENAAFWQSDQIRRDDTLASLINRLNIRNTDAIDFLKYNTDASPLASQLRPGRAIQAQTSPNGQLLKLQYQTDNSSTLIVELTESGYVAHLDSTASETHPVLKSAEIKSSLFGATDDAGIPDNIAIQLAEIFSSDIDFHTDLRRGDGFTVVYEENYANGEPMSAGKVLAAEFINNGKTYSAIMYRNPEGQVSYYTPDGKNLHKSFLRSPLEFSRISSGFSLGRFHPILQTMRAHKGVDYAAPIGTGVKAPADGIVDFVGIKNGYGNVVVLKHQNNISTVYGHLSRFASGLRRGTHVSQGDLIAYVGMTGLATGPHLHYEFLVNGQHHDPVTVPLPNAVPIAAQYRADFFAHSAELANQLKLLSTSSVAAIE